MGVVLVTVLEVVPEGVPEEAVGPGVVLPLVWHGLFGKE